MIPGDVTANGVEQRLRKDGMVKDESFKNPNIPFITLSFGSRVLAPGFWVFDHGHVGP